MEQKMEKTIAEATIRDADISELKQMVKALSEENRRLQQQLLGGLPPHPTISDRFQRVRADIGSARQQLNEQAMPATQFSNEVPYSQRNKSAVSKVFELCSAMHFHIIDPCRINTDMKITDIDSLYAYIRDKRNNYISTIQGSTASDPNVVREAMETMAAKFRHLPPAPVPIQTAIGLTLTAVDNCGHQHLVNHINDAVCAGIELGSTEACRQLLQQIRSTGAIPYHFDS